MNTTPWEGRLLATLKDGALCLAVVYATTALGTTPPGPDFSPI